MIAFFFMWVGGATVRDHLNIAILWSLWFVLFGISLALWRQNRLHLRTSPRHPLAVS